MSARHDSPPAAAPAGAERRGIWLVLALSALTITLGVLVLRRRSADARSASASAPEGGGAKAVEPAGGDARSASVEPSVQIFAPAEGASLRSIRVRVKGRAHGLHAIWINEEKTAVAQDGAIDTDVDLAHGEGEIRITAPGKDGAQRELALVHVVVDLEDPVIQIDTLPGIQIDDPPFARLVAAGPALIAGRVVDAWPGRPDRIALDGGPILMAADGAFQTDVALLGDGQRVVALEARDAAGNVARQRIVVVRDTTPPVLTIDSSAVGEGLSGKDAVLIRGRVADPHPARVLLDGVPIPVDRDGEFERDIVLEKGRTVLRFVGEDRMGNRSEEVVVELER